MEMISYLFKFAVSGIARAIGRVERLVAKCFGRKGSPQRACEGQERIQTDNDSPPPSPHRKKEHVF